MLKIMKVSLQRRAPVKPYDSWGSLKFSFTILGRISTLSLKSLTRRGYLWKILHPKGLNTVGSFTLEISYLLDPANITTDLDALLG